MGGIKLSSNFELNRFDPIDSRLKVNNITERDNIIFKYYGLQVYVNSEDKFYYWAVGDNWKEIGLPPEPKILLYQKNQQIAGTTIGNNFNTGLICNINVVDNINIIVNGLECSLENDINDVAYFSIDGGLTATNIFLGATFFWNGLNNGYNLDTYDKITFKGFGFL